MNLDGTTTASALPSTGVDSLDSLQAAMQSYLQLLASQGMKINPDVQITPAMLQQFYDSATQNLGPIYAAQLGSVKDDLVANLQTTAQQYAEQVAQEGVSFKQAVASSQQSESLAGDTSSSANVQAQQAQQETEQNTLDTDQLEEQSYAAAQARSAEQQVGTAAVQNLPLPALASYSALTGTGGGTVTATPGVATQYTGAALYPSYVVGVSQTSPWLAVVSCSNENASSDGIGFSTILTTVSYIPKF